MAMSISTQSPNGQNGIAVGQVRISLTVDVLKAQKSAAFSALAEAASEFEAPEPAAAAEADA